MAMFKHGGVCFVLLCMVVFAPYAEATVTCSTVETKLASCLNYLKKGGTVSTNCCSGVKALYSAASTTADRQTVCKCLKSLYKSITGISINYASALPGKCGVNVGYKISTSTDCAKVK